ILSEVVHRDLAGAHPQSGRMLSEMAESARSLVDAMGDIVWSIDPRKDDLDDLVVRIRQFAFDLLEPRKVRWRLNVSEGVGVKLEADQRRHVFLILKEALTNAVKHSGSTDVKIAIGVDGGRFYAQVWDEGRGLDARCSGNGLRNMRARA